MQVELPPLVDPLGEAFRYASLYDEQEFGKLGKQPPELAAHAKTLKALTGRGLQLVSFSTDPVAHNNFGKRSCQGLSETWSATPRRVRWPRTTY